MPDRNKQRNDKFPFDLPEHKMMLVNEFAKAERKMACLRRTDPQRVMVGHNV
jgi:hypothetical protein